MYRRNYPHDPGFAASVSAARAAHFAQPGSIRRSIRRSYPSIAAGTVLLLAGVCVLIWNEGRAVAVDRALSEGLDTVVSLPAEVVSERYDGSLVHVSGPIRTSRKLVDSEFGLHFAAVRMRRIVEMLQWVERVDDSADDDASKSASRSTDYSLEWRRELIDSSRFVAGASKRNPASMPIATREFVADSCQLGAFQLDAAFVEQVQADTPLPDAAEQLPLQQLAARGFVWRHGRLFSSPSAAAGHAQVGDLRLSWTVGGISGEAYSAIGQQRAGQRLVPHSSQALALMGRGYQPAGRMFAGRILHNRVLTWALRAAGWLLLFLAVTLMTSLAEAIVESSAILRRSSLAALPPLTLSVCVSGSASLAVISVAWLRYRPVIGLAVVAFSLLPMLAPRLATAAAAANNGRSQLYQRNY